MENEVLEPRPAVAGMQHPELPAQQPQPYEPPKVISYRGQDILRALGPAQSCNSFVCPTHVKVPARW